MYRIYHSFMNSVHVSLFNRCFSEGFTHKGVDFFMVKMPTFECYLE